MNKREATRIIGLLQANYPDTYKAMSDDALSVVVNTWASAFQAEPFSLVEAAVMAYIADSPADFAPNPGKIKEQIRQLTHPDELTEAEAWALVMEAARNSSNKAVFDNLPPLIQRAIGSFSTFKQYGLMSPDQLSVEHSHFARSYRAAQSQEAEREKTPERVKQYFEGITKPMPEAMPAPAPAQEAPRLEAPPLVGEEMRAAIAAARGAAGDVIITKDAKTAALERLRNYGEV